MGEHMNDIINFIQYTSYEDLPYNVKKNIKYAFKDTVAVTLAAANSTETKIIMDIISESNEIEEEMPSIELALTSKPVDTAFLLGTMSHVLDFDDVNFTFQGHPSVTLIPIILTLGKEYDLTGKEMMLSYAVGFEVEARIGEAIGSDQYNLGYHTTATIGIFGAVAAVSVLMKFNDDQIRYAFGLASSLASGSRKNFGTMTKPLHVGFLTKNVYLISRLISKGITATDDIFSEPIPIDRMTTGKSIDLSVTQKLGNTWELGDFGVIFKKYPCCAYTHRSIDALLELIQFENVSYDEVESIEVVVHYKVPAVLIYPEAKTALEGKFSMQYCLAAALYDREITLQTFTDDNVNRTTIQDLMKKIIMTIDENQKEGTDSKERTATIKLFTKRKALNKRVDYPVGHPGNPFTEADMYEKFSMCLNGVYPSSGIKSLYEMLSSLDKCNFSNIEDRLLGNK